MTRLRSTPVAFAIFGVIFVVSHVLSFPGSLAYLMEVTGGQPILDMRPSPSSDDVYARLFAMGEDGRAAYLRLIVTVDILFPLAMLNFLVAWAKSLGVRRAWLLPSVAFLADMVENVFVLVLLLAWPERVVPLAATLAVFTVTKRAAMIAAFAWPPLVGIRAFLRARSGVRRAN